MELIECPSGLSGEIRGLTGKSGTLLTDRQLLRSGLFMDKMFASCWQVTHDPGPYELGDNGHPDWQKVLTGDRIYAFVRIRAATFGKTWAFTAQCRSCRTSVQEQIDLLELPVHKLSDEAKAAFRDGNRFTGELPDGKKFVYRLPTGKDETRMAKLSSTAAPRNFIPALLSRIEEIEGVDNNLRYLEDAELGYALTVSRIMQEHDCGVVTDYAMECPQCFAISEIPLPFDQGFLMPKQEPSRLTSTQI